MSYQAYSPAISFFKADRYFYTDKYTFNTSDAPRPHFCMGLILSGSVSLKDTKNGDTCQINAGNIIFVPMNSTYIATWQGNPEIEYISLHFVIDMPSPFSRLHGFKLSSVNVSDFESMRRDFDYILNNYTARGAERLCSIGKFYTILSYVIPNLEVKKSPLDKRIEAAMEYTERNYREDITVEQMASVANMSSSRFYPKFKSELGQTPTDYVNRVRIGRAMVMMYDKSLSVEQISEAVGYNSPIYFRRVFKKMTGKTPKEYMKTSFEM